LSKRGAIFKDELGDDDDDDHVLDNVVGAPIVLLAADTWKACAPWKTVPSLPLPTRKRRNADANTAGMERVVVLADAADEPQDFWQSFGRKCFGGRL
jgi:hypothetical protein